MKKLYRIIIGILFFGVFWLCEYIFINSESENYLKSDINNLKDNLFLISILVSTIIAFLMVFEENLKGGKWKKTGHLIYIIIMSFLIYPMTASILLTSVLKMNKISEREQFNESFIISDKDLYDNNDNYVWGRIPNKTEYGQTEKIKLNKIFFDQVKENQEIKLKLKKGVFGIPYDPVGTK